MAKVNEVTQVKKAKTSNGGDARGAAADVRAYLAALPPAARKRMQQIRSIIRTVAPAAVEHFSYRIPAFRLDGQALIWYAAFKRHTSLYPITPALVRAHRLHLSGYETSKGTIRLPLDAALPVALVQRIVKARVAEARERAATARGR